MKNQKFLFCCPQRASYITPIHRYIRLHHSLLSCVLCLFDSARSASCCSLFSFSALPAPSAGRGTREGKGGEGRRRRGRRSRAVRIGSYYHLLMHVYCLHSQIFPASLTDNGMCERINPPSRPFFINPPCGPKQKIFFLQPDKKPLKRFLRFSAISETISRLIRCSTNIR